MATAVSAPRVPPAASADPRPRRWTRAEYYRLTDAGFFQGQRVMLVAGEILQMSPINHPHAAATTLTQEALRAAFGGGVWIRVQMPLDLGQDSEPEPDVAVASGSPRSYTAHPTTALLIVEVADSSLAYDTADKASLYAAAGIADYWVVDLVHRRLVVFRDPKPDAAQPFGAGYARHAYLGPTGAIAPLAAPQSPITVADLLP